MSRIFSFAPLANADATRLILGSKPGAASLQAQQYYAHPRNLFWPIMGALVEATPALQYTQRIQALQKAGIALWDVLYSCIRKGSLDTAIESTSLVPNDFEAFFAQYPQITHVYFNGMKAEACFRRQVLPQLRSRSLHYTRLPSTSPAHATLSYAQKLEAWRQIIDED